MRNSILIGVMVSCAILGGVVGGGIQANRDQAQAEASWQGLAVMQGGTLVANPAALTPRELADVKIIDPAKFITVCTDQSGNVFVNPKDGECSDWKSIRHL